MDAIDRLREAARNEATCIELSRQNKELRARVARLEELLRIAANNAHDSGEEDSFEDLINATLEEK